MRWNDSLKLLEPYRPPVRVAAWGQTGISFWVRSQGRPRRVAVMLFPTTRGAPYSGIPGSPIRRQYVAQVRDWVQTGEIPEEAKLA